jgi:hypothetical protein
VVLNKEVVLNKLADQPGSGRMPMYIRPENLAALQPIKRLTSG